MSSPIDFIRSSGPVLPVQPLDPRDASSARPGEFQSLLADAVQRVEQYRADATLTTERFLAGDGVDLHQVALATQKAELAFEFFLQARNKVVRAYEEVMRMQV
jgi:flagellar hook-basal body complex protein FliE